MSDDKNFKRIKEIVENILPCSRIILFGSRIRGDFNIQSDYDILVVVSSNLTIKEKRNYAIEIINKLAGLDILTDVIVKTEADVIYYKDKIGSITREAILEGITI